MAPVALWILGPSSVGKSTIAAGNPWCRAPAKSSKIAARHVWGGRSSQVWHTLSTAKSTCSHLQLAIPTSNNVHQYTEVAQQLIQMLTRGLQLREQCCSLCLSNLSGEQSFNKLLLCVCVSMLVMVGSSRASCIHAIRRRLDAVIVDGEHCLPDCVGLCWVMLGWGLVWQSCSLRVVHLLQLSLVTSFEGFRF